MVSGAFDGAVRIWNAFTGAELVIMNSITSVSWSPDGGHVASCNFDSDGCIWNAATGDEILTLKGHSARVESRFASVGIRFLGQNRAYLGRQYRCQNSYS